MSDQKKDTAEDMRVDQLGVTAKPPNLDDPRVVLSLLEADQVVAEKRQTRFGRRNLSLSLRMLLWGLRVYVVLMLVIVLIDVLRTLHPNP